MPDYDITRLEQQIAAGVELRSGAVAALLDVSRGTVHNWIKHGKIRYRRTGGGQRLLNAEDVARLLAETRQIRQDGGVSPGRDTPAPSPEPEPPAPGSAAGQ